MFFLYVISFSVYKITIVDFNMAATMAQTNAGNIFGKHCCPLIVLMFSPRNMLQDFRQCTRGVKVCCVDMLRAFVLALGV